MSDTCELPNFHVALPNQCLTSKSALSMCTNFHYLVTHVEGATLGVSKRRPEELPEVVLGAARVYRTDFTEPRPFPARLTRTTSDMPDTPV